MRTFSEPLKELESAEEAYRQAFEASPTAQVMVDVDGKIVMINSEAERLFLYERGALAGKSIDTLIPNRYREKHPEYRANFHQDPTARKMGAGRDLHALRSDGSEFPVEIGLTPIQLQGQTYVLSVIIDITERLKTQNDLETLNTALRKKSSEMEQFVYTVSHDLRSPLVTSMSFIGFLKEDIEGRDWDKTHESVLEIEKSIKRMSLLIDDLLQLSRIGHIEIKSCLTDVKTQIMKAIDNAATLIGDRTLDFEIQGDFIPVYVDESKFLQVIDNLVSNAIKYAWKAKDFKITFSCEQFENEICFQIQDNGPGISEEYHKKIFGLFQRLDQSKEGTGVGLTIVSKVMQLHGGRAEIKSRMGEGAAFRLYLPIWRKNSSNPPTGDRA